MIQNSLRKLILSFDVKIVDSEAKIVSENKILAGEEAFECKNIIIATGAKPAQIKGLETDGEFILNSDELLCCERLPENILIVGSGAIGVEWARILSSLNKNVTVVEIAKNLLPSADEAVSQRLERLFKKDKIKFFKETLVEKIENKKVYLKPVGADMTTAQTTEFEPDMVIVAAGREPVLPGIANLELKLNGKFVAVNENFQTNIENIYAIGDVNGKMQLAHASVHQAIGAVDYIVDKKSAHFDVCKIPCVVYGSPEIAWVGKSELFLEGQDYKVSCFPVAALGKAQADDEIDGLIKVLSVNEKIIGAHIVSPEASALIQQFALMIDNEIPVEKILETTFAHPTYSEGIFEAVLGLDNLSLSLPRAQ